MAKFEEGNQFGVGEHNTGRPREYDIEKMAKDLIEWCAKPSSLNLLGFANKHRMPAQNISTWAKENHVFSEALKIAKSEIGERRELMLNYGKLHQAAFNKAQHMYDCLLKDHAHEELEFEYGLKNKLETNKDRGLTINLVEKPWKDDDNNNSK